LENYFKQNRQIWQQSFVGALYTPLSYFIWFFAGIELLDFLFHYISDNPIVLRKEILLSVGGILALIWFLMKWKNRAVLAILMKAKVNKEVMDRTRLDAVNKILTVVIILIGGMLLLDATGNNLNTLIAFGGISGLALAFASQEVIASFFGGLMIYLTYPFEIGDWIILPEKSIEGYVEEIGWYNTKIRTLDKRPIYVPNSIFSKIVVVNPSQMSHRQFKDTIGIRYRDVAALKGIIADIRQMLERNPAIDQEMSNSVYFTAFGAYSLDISLTAYTFETSTLGFNRIREKMLFEIIEILDKHNAELAYPTTCVETTGATLPISFNLPPSNYKN
jgi:MscS family membrane protein